MYTTFVYDFLYRFNFGVGIYRNHDTDRFLGEGDNLPMLNRPLLILTTRRIPQLLYYGTEIMMNGVKSKVMTAYVRTSRWLVTTKRMH